MKSENIKYLGIQIPPKLHKKIQISMREKRKNHERVFNAAYRGSNQRRER
jgi:hypothetical protein